MYQMIGFDFDGTIADTLPLCIEAFQNSLTPHIGHRPSEDEITRTFGVSETGTIKSLAGEHWQPALKDFYREYTRLHREYAVTPFPGIRSLLDTLRDRGILLALITGKGKESCRISLEYLGLTDSFHEILCGSEEIPNKSQHIKMLLSKYHISKENFCYVGDAVSDIDSCKSVGVTCLSAAWQTSPDITKLQKCNPRNVFLRISDLPLWEASEQFS